MTEEDPLAPARGVIAGAVAGGLFWSGLIMWLIGRGRL